LLVQAHALLGGNQERPDKASHFYPQELLAGHQYLIMPHVKQFNRSTKLKTNVIF
jgi:hypothetical protein